MSGQYDNNLRGALFKNDRKREGKKDAEYRGECEIDGIAYYVDAWINESKGGKKYLSLKFKRKAASQEAKPIPVVATVEDFDDAIPF